MDWENKRIGLSVAVAGLAHAVVLGLSVASPRSAPPLPHPVATLEIVWSADPASGRSIARDDRTVGPGSASIAALVQRPRSERPNGVGDEIPVSTADATMADSTVVVAVSEDAASEPLAMSATSPTLVDVAPDAAALALVLDEVTLPLAPSGRTAPTPRADEEVERSLGSALRRDALTKAHVSPVRELRLLARPDGSYHYDGLGFDAEILPDGRVVFHDEGHASVDEIGLGPVTLTPDGRVALRAADAPLALTPRPREAGPESTTVFDQAPSGASPLDVLQLGVRISGRFDLDGAMHEAHGSDPHQAERARFLEETEALRERLEEDARRRRAERRP